MTAVTERPTSTSPTYYIAAPPRRGLRRAEKGADGATSEVCSRWWLTVFAAAFVAICMAQEPGRIVFDTKLALGLAPGPFLSHALHLWNPLTDFGEVQNQAYGYLFPMGPFFLVGHLLHLPLWCLQRLWVATLLTVGAWGIVRLAEALRIGTTRSRMLAGFVFALSPITVSAGETTASLLPAMLLPFLVAPLVRGAVGGSPRKAAARSGVAFALMGGINATLNLAVLPLPVLWLATRERSPRRRALIGWWVLAIVLASFWWAFSLWLNGRYGLNFIKYTESSAATTATSSAFEGIRGGSFWLNYFNLGMPSLPGGWIMVSQTAPIVGSAALAAIGLFGVARRSVPERLFLVAAVCAGVLTICIGYAGPFGGPLADQTRELLQGPLAPFRNVAKFGPVVALPLALGLAHAAGRLEFPHLHRLRRLLPRALAGGVTAVILVALVASSTPWIRQQFFPSGGFSQVPSYWARLSSWLAAQPGSGTALMVPGSSFGTYTWGRPLDEPFESLARSPWAVRNLIPLGGVGSTRLMDAVEQELDAGRSSPGLSVFLARAGIGYLVVRNDLDRRTDNIPPPAQLATVLGSTPGLTRVARFGPTLAAEGAAAQWGAPSTGPDITSQLRAVEVYKVGEPPSTARLYSASDPVLVSGGPDALLAMADDGVLGGRPILLAGDGQAAKAAAAQPGAAWVDTDTLRRVDVTFGLIRNNSSYTLAPGQLSPDTGRPPQDLDVVPGVSHQTTAELNGVKSITSSSYGSLSIAPSPANGPLAAFDGDPSTYWVADAAHDSVGQSVSVTMEHPQPVSEVIITPLLDGPWRPTVERVRIDTAQGSVTRSLEPNERPQVLAVQPGMTSWLKVTLQRVRPPVVTEAIAGAGLRDIVIPGVHVSQSLATPSDENGPFSRPGAQPPTYLLTSPVNNARFNFGVTAAQEPSLQRLITVPSAATFAMVGQVTARPGPALDNLLARLAGPTNVHATASSTFGNLPQFRADNAVDGNPLTLWMAGSNDLQPTLDLTWSGSRSVNSMLVQPSAQASPPTALRITAPGGTREVAVPPGGGIVKFAPLVTDHLLVSLLGASSPSPTATGGVTTPPVGVADLAPTVVPGSPSVAPSTPVHLACGQGPMITVDGKAVATRVDGTVNDLNSFLPLTLSACGAPTALSAGQHAVDAEDVSTAFQVTSLTVANPLTLLADAAVPASPRSLQVARWGTVERQVEVGSGPASYLAVAENYNKGWTASLDGKTLTPVELDGWQQGWLVPPGGGGVVIMRYSADTWYRAGLAAGALLVLALLILVVAPVRRRREPPPVGPVRIPPLALGIGAGAALALIAGPLALLMIPLVILGRWRRGLLSALAPASFLAAGAFAGAIVAHHHPGPGIGALSGTAQILAVLALASVLAAAVLAMVRSPNGQVQWRRRDSSRSGLLARWGRRR